jgi:hypothetical protein
MAPCFNNAMALLVCLALIWLSARTLLLLLQAQRHSDEARLGRAFQQELRQRGLITPRWFAVDGPPGGGWDQASR